MDAAISNGFERTLRDLRQGEALTELTNSLQEPVTAVRETGRAGGLTFKIKVKPASRGDGIAVILEDDVVVKLPKAERANTIMFSTEDGALQRNDPRQKEFPLRTVEAPEIETSKLRKVG